MITFKAIQPSIPTLHPSFPYGRNFTGKDKDKSIICFCSSKDEGSDSSPSGGDKRKQELLARIAMLQAQKVRLTNFLDERAEYLTKFAEDANSQFDEIGQNALKELDEAGARIMENLESRMQAFEEKSQVNRQEIEKNEKVLEDFEDQMERDRNEGLFFKNLREKKPTEKAAAKVEAQKLKAITKENAGSKLRRNIYLVLMSLLAVAIANGLFNTTEVEWRKIAALGLIFVGLLAQLIYEQSLSSTTCKRSAQIPHQDGINGRWAESATPHLHHVLSQSLRVSSISSNSLLAPSNP